MLSFDIKLHPNIYILYLTRDTIGYNNIRFYTNIFIFYFVRYNTMSEKKEKHTVNISDENWVHLKKKQIQDRKYLNLILDDILTEYFSDKK